jgi:branched-chain amino acid transport system permease protein
VIDWWLLFEIVLAGLGSGGLYALTGLAFVTIYKATRVVNIAIGEMLMVGAYLFFSFSVGLHCRSGRRSRRRCWPRACSARWSSA